MKRLAAMIIVALMVAASASEGWSQRRTTTRKKAKSTVETIYGKVAASSMEAAPERGIVVSGYDKPRRSTRETVLVTNNTEHAICQLQLTIRYVDMQGRMLHTATVRLKCDIPAGETRMVGWKSWDRQQSYYYRLSKNTRNSTATPYEVGLTVDSIENKL